jgi:iron-sulfur cluster repair protein YtfE (RIC family)
MHPYQDMVTDHQRLVMHAQATLHEVHHSHPLPPGLLKSLGRCLRSHVRIEEDIVFAAAEQLHGKSVRAVTAALRHEHAALCALLSTVEVALTFEDRAALLGALRELLQILRTHCEKEEVELYPLLRSMTDSGQVVAC